MKYMKDRKIKKLKIQMAGLKEEAETLRMICLSEHIHSDEMKMVAARKRYAELGEELNLLLDNNE